jgi:hypothetical protein
MKNISLAKRLYSQCDCADTQCDRANTRCDRANTLCRERLDGIALVSTQVTKVVSPHNFDHTNPAPSRGKNK